MPYALNNIATGNNYGPSTTLVCPDAVRIQFSILNAFAYISIGTSPVVGGAQQGQEILYPPGVYILDRFAATIAARSGAAGVPAKVNLAAWRKGEISDG